MSDAGDGCRYSRDPGAVHQEGCTGLEAGVVRHGVLFEAVGEKLEALLGKIKDDREQRKQWTSRRESPHRRKADMECGERIADSKVSFLVDTGSGVSILAALI